MYGTEGHIIEVKKGKQRYPEYYPTKGRKCRYKDENGKCSADGYINKGNDCERPRYCKNFNGILM